MVLTALTIVCIFMAGLGMTFVVMRLAEQQAQPAFDQTGQIRLIAGVEAEQKLDATPMQVVPKLDTMVDGSDLIVQRAKSSDAP